jgi:hypothetical protein
MSEADQAAEKRSQRGVGLRRQKGWPGFVHGYKDFLEKADWKAINWSKDPKDSGAKSVESDGKGKIIYTF